LTLVVCSVLFAVLAAELWLRIAGSKLIDSPLPLSYDVAAIDELGAGRSYIEFDPELGWVTTPGADRRIEGIEYENNSEGLRGKREYSATPAPGVRRISAYGDSYTYCDESRLDDCWTHLLERSMPGLEVLNFGVSGYGPDQAWLRYQHDGAARRPCAVTIGYTVENINRVVNRFRPFYAPTTKIALSKPRFVLEGGSLRLLANPARRPEQLKDPVWVEANLGPSDAWYFPGTFVANPMDRLYLGSLTRTALYKRERLATVRWNEDRAEQMYRPGSEAFEVTRAILAGFADQVRSDGATPIILIFPWGEEISRAREGQTQAHAPLVDGLRKLGIAIVDLAEPLGEEARRTRLERLVADHYTPLANAVVSRTLAAQLPALTSATCGAG
jgi:hypothetical protein